MTTQHHGPDPEFIKGLFGSISGGYDRANDLMTFGVARFWRKQLVKWSEAQQGDRVLDCATGTGDLALAFAEKVGPTGQVVGSDFCPEMLAVAPEKARKLGVTWASFEVADALDLPYEDNSFNVTSIAFGIRNVQDPVKALREMARVTQPGGRVMILETGDNRMPVVGPMIQFYFKVGVPFLGGLVTGKKSAYEYLNNSSNKFPGQKKFLDLMRASQAFSQVECRSLLGGASYLYKGVVA
ncbi:MAG: bifunctional demethylmenaquinone methyltransferase/2-methoxy-6-polyprenyl-1,4-benzoquinol methylase UbiE [Bdellovibrionaceae bacterium]|nr:bifunctional demethylmenaquinone methyltransferase/2-methoxy-6-polyprenyl-1,4-benzoquinol methylase UbiE [Bdellovibrionales bacterium]MCB9084959.1 bifunctional demethylmenaquinone methyltransferase/2-methoxy-6-polyprenyl-1,4-benzoquinol methylase UbiE [Pseudobdellovibrionaceae bacterium]